MEKTIETLVKKAAESHDAGEAMKFTQAALNAANAIYSLNELKKSK